MKRIALLLLPAATVAGVIAAVPPTGRTDDVASPQVAREAGPPRTAREVRGHTPYFAVQNEPPPKLIVDEPLPDGLPQGIVWIQYRTENCRLLPVFGKEGLKLSPRVGHLHVRVDDMPWLWADSSDNNTVDIGGMPPGEHKVTIELVDATHQTYPGQSKTVKFTIPKSAAHAH
jgi:hypothetical protein